MKLGEGNYRHSWDVVGQGSEAHCEPLFTWCCEKEKKKKKIERNKWEKKQKLLFFPKLGATSRVRTGGQKLFSVTQPFPSCLPTPRPSGKSPEEDSTGVNALTPLALGGHRNTADFNQLRLWLLPAQNGLTGE